VQKTHACFCFEKKKNPFIFSFRRIVFLFADAKPIKAHLANGSEMNRRSSLNAIGNERQCHGSLASLFDYLCRVDAHQHTLLGRHLTRREFALVRGHRLRACALVTVRGAGFRQVGSGIRHHLRGKKKKEQKEERNRWKGKKEKISDNNQVHTSNILVFKTDFLYVSSIMKGYA